MSEDGSDARGGRNDREEADAAAWNDAGRSDDESTGRIPIDLSSDADESDGEAADEPYAPEPNSASIEAGDLDLENAAFVLLGAAATIVVLLRLLSLPF